MHFHPYIKLSDFLVVHFKHIVLLLVFKSDRLTIRTGANLIIKVRFMRKNNFSVSRDDNTHIQYINAQF
ncbi:hypothetical protein D3C80_2108200 [compost metagenome]